MLMLPVEETLLRCRGDVSPDTTGDLYTISAPWSVLALAFSRKVSLCVSIYREETGRKRASCIPGKAGQALPNAPTHGPLVGESWILDCSPIDSTCARTSPHLSPQRQPPSRAIPHIHKRMCLINIVIIYTCLALWFSKLMSSVLSKESFLMFADGCSVHIITADVLKIIYSPADGYLKCFSVFLLQTMLCTNN